jgi:hypothetical protein
MLRPISTLLLFGHYTLLNVCTYSCAVYSQPFAPAAAWGANPQRAAGVAGAAPPATAAARGRSPGGCGRRSPRGRAGRRPGAAPPAAPMMHHRRRRPQTAPLETACSTVTRALAPTDSVASSAAEALWRSCRQLLSVVDDGTVVVQQQAAQVLHLGTAKFAAYLTISTRKPTCEAEDAVAHVDWRHDNVPKAHPRSRRRCAPAPAARRRASRAAGRKPGLAPRGRPPECWQPPPGPRRR